ncbi:MAG: hypothetical protein GF417_06080 [Candidatus Latescibacteria bacterium]|nr:hypothetical protein [bacterium]MBD3423986.1 hypothetical protein [Candidatus Latescibacterota bacterium]
MRRGIFLLIAVCLLVFSCSSHRAGVSVQRPHPRDLKYPDLKLTMPEYQEFTLDNGMEVFFIEDHEIPIVNISMLVKNYYPPREKLGRNTMAAWVMRNGGSENWPADKLNDELEFRAARISFSGQSLNTTISLDCLKKDLPDIMAIYADLIMHPVFPEDKIEMKRKTMLEALRRKNDKPRNIAGREYGKLIYRGHPYGWEPTEENYQNITREDLVEFHESYFHPGNTIVGISGDVTREEIISLLNEKFRGWEESEVTVQEVPPVELEERKNFNYAEKADMNQAYIMMGHLGIRNDHPRRCAINIMNYILGGGSFASWITEEVRVKKGLAYSAGSYVNHGAFARGTYTAYAQTKAEEYHRSLKIIMDQIERMRTEGPTQEEFNKAIDSYLNSQVFEYESKERIIGRLMMLKFQGRPLNTPEMDMEKYAALTIEDIREAAKEYLRPEMITVLVVGNREKFAKPLSSFGEVNEIELE